MKFVLILVLTAMVYADSKAHHKHSLTRIPAEASASGEQMPTRLLSTVQPCAERAPRKHAPTILPTVAPEKIDLHGGRPAAVGSEKGIGRARQKVGTGRWINGWDKPRIKTNSFG